MIGLMIIWVLLVIGLACDVLVFFWVEMMNR